MIEPSAVTSPERVLVFSPHPDDVELFLGGTLLRHVAEGAAVQVVMMTRGEKGSLFSLLGKSRQGRLKRIRTAELEQRYSLIPTVDVHHLDLPDRGVRESATSVARVLESLQEFGPNLIYLPESVGQSSLYTHPDHLATGRIVEAADRQRAEKVNRRYYHSRRPNTLVDVSPFHEENRCALRCYRTQYSWQTGIPFLLRHYERVWDRRTRNYGLKLGVEFAEAFRQAN